jgi:hypothetical protein
LASVVYRVSNTVTEVVTLSLSGTTITVNTAGKAAFGGSADIICPVISSLSATSFALAYTDATDSNKGTAQIGTISSTTITAGASEYNFSSTNFATRRLAMVTISSTETILAYTEATNTSYVVRLSVASTVITFDAPIQLGTGTLSVYPQPLSYLNLSYTKSGQLTFSYLTKYLNQFICGMLTYINNTASYQIYPMCYRILTVDTGEQIELSSVYLYSNYSGLAYATNATWAKLYLDGTLSNNAFYSTRDNCDPSYNQYPISECKRLGMSNEPIILTEGQSLYASLNAIQGGQNYKGSCTVFGLKRS